MEKMCNFECEKYQLLIGSRQVLNFFRKRKKGLNAKMQRVCVAEDVPARLIMPIVQECRFWGISLEFVHEKAELGRMAGIEVPASCVGILSSMPLNS